MRQVQSPVICHQNDDDLWLPGHFEVLEQALENADFVGAIQVNVDTDDKVRAHYFDLERPEFVEAWLKWKPNELGAWAYNGFGPFSSPIRARPSCASRKDGRRRGGTAGRSGDVAPLRARGLVPREISALADRAAFPSPDRNGWSVEQRGEEMPSLERDRRSAGLRRADLARSIARPRRPVVASEPRRTPESRQGYEERQKEYELRQNEYELRRSVGRDRDALLWRLRWLRRARHPLRSAASVRRECRELVGSLWRGQMPARSADLDPRN